MSKARDDETKRNRDAGLGPGQQIRDQHTPKSLMRGALRAGSGASGPLAPPPMYSNADPDQWQAQQGQQGQGQLIAGIGGTASNVESTPRSLMRGAAALSGPPGPLTHAPQSSSITSHSSAGNRQDDDSAADLMRGWVGKGGDTGAGDSFTEDTEDTEHKEPDAEEKEPTELTSDAPPPIKINMAFSSSTSSTIQTNETNETNATNEVATPEQFEFEDSIDSITSTDAVTMTMPNPDSNSNSADQDQDQDPEHTDTPRTQHFTEVISALNVDDRMAAIRDRNTHTQHDSHTASPNPSNMTNVTTERGRGPPKCLLDSTTDDDIDRGRDRDRGSLDLDKSNSNVDVDEDVVNDVDVDIDISDMSISPLVDRNGPSFNSGLKSQLGLGLGLGIGLESQESPPGVKHSHSQEHTVHPNAAHSGFAVHKKMAGGHGVTHQFIQSSSNVSVSAHSTPVKSGSGSRSGSSSAHSTPQQAKREEGESSGPGFGLGLGLGLSPDKASHSSTAAAADVDSSPAKLDNANSSDNTNSTPIPAAKPVFQAYRPPVPIKGGLGGLSVGGSPTAVQGIEQPSFTRQLRSFSELQATADAAAAVSIHNSVTHIRQQINGYMNLARRTHHTSLTTHPPNLQTLTLTSTHINIYIYIYMHRSQRSRPPRVHRPVATKCTSTILTPPLLLLLLVARTAAPTGITVTVAVEAVSIAVSVKTLSTPLITIMVCTREVVIPLIIHLHPLQRQKGQNV